MQLKGKVHKIDKDGDALIAFDGFDKKHWVKKSNFCNLQVIDEEVETEAVNATEAISEGAHVKVTTEFRSSSKNPIELPVGLKGKVHKIDKDGDALIAFDDHDTKHWVKKVHFCNLTLVQAEKVAVAKGQGKGKGKLEYTSLEAEKPFVCAKCKEAKTACDRCWGSGKSCWGCSGFGFNETGTGQDCCLCDGMGNWRNKQGTRQIVRSAEVLAKILIYVGSAWAPAERSAAGAGGAAGPNAVIAMHSSNRQRIQQDRVLSQRLESQSNSAALPMLRL